MAKGRFKDDSGVFQSREGGHDMVACILGSLLCVVSGETESQVHCYTSLKSCPVASLLGTSEDSESTESPVSLELDRVL